jgi:hypothetical protein
MRFIFPSNYFNPKQVDESYSEEFDCLRNIGLETSVISLESLTSGTSKILPIPVVGTKLVYRGWMLTPENYSLLVDNAKSVGSEMWISVDEYRSNHYLPNWYSSISDLTPETHFFAVDVIDRKDGCQRIVEIGDGQVSGLVGWSAAYFATLWTDL